MAAKGMEKKARIFTISFASVYPLYVQKAEKKGRTREEVDRVIEWLTGYDRKKLKRAIDTKVDLETFFTDSPRMNPNAKLITGVVCGIRVEEIEDPLMQKIRYLDKLIDELAKGKKMESILREELSTSSAKASSAKASKAKASSAKEAASTKKTPSTKRAPSAKPRSAMARGKS
jgi:hypothetical protein